MNAVAILLVTRRALNDRHAAFHAPDSGGDRPGMDALSDVLRVIRLAGAVFLEAEFTAPWCVSGKVSPDVCRAFQVAPRHVIASHCVTEGRMQLKVQGAEPVDIRAGEFILLPHNDTHVFGSDVRLPFTPVREFFRAPAGSSMVRVRSGGGGATTQMLCGFLGSDIAFTPLLSALPPMMKLNMRSSASGHGSAFVPLCRK